MAQSLCYDAVLIEDWLPLLEVSLNSVIKVDLVLVFVNDEDNY
jgi:hypothetical protein